MHGFGAGDCVTHGERAADHEARCAARRGPIVCGSFGSGGGERHRLAHHVRGGIGCAGVLAGIGAAGQKRILRGQAGDADVYADSHHGAQHRGDDCSSHGVSVPYRG